MQPHGRDADWLNGFNRDPNRQAQKEALQTVGGASAVLNEALETHLRDSVDQVNHDVEKLAAYQFYSLPAGFRNRRFHYSCRPWDHDQELEDFAILIWLWLCKGWLGFKQGKRPVSAAQTPFPAILAEAAKSRWLPRSSWSISEDSWHGADACALFVLNLRQMLETGVFTLGGHIEPLRKAIDQLAQLAEPLSEQDADSEELEAPMEIADTANQIEWASIAQIQLFELVGTPIPPEISRGDINEAVKEAGFKNAPKRVRTSFQLVVDTVAQCDALNRARSAGINIGDRRVTLRPIAAIECS